MTARDSPRLAEGMELLRLVARQIHKQLGQRVDVDELQGFGHEALALIVARYDESSGVAFRAYARVRLRGAMVDGLRKATDLPRGLVHRLRALEASDRYVDGKAEETAVRAGDAAVADARLGAYLAGIATAYATGLCSRGEEAEGEEQDDPETLAMHHEVRQRIEAALATIGDPEATILRRHYLQGEDLDDAAAAAGVSKSWGSRLHARGIDKLRKRLAGLEL